METSDHNFHLRGRHSPYNRFKASRITIYRLIFESTMSYANQGTNYPMTRMCTQYKCQLDSSVRIMVAMTTYRAFLSSKMTITSTKNNKHSGHSYTAIKITNRIIDLKMLAIIITLTVV
uniref:Uncharacterized protein n=1 Tax=Cacopsylla melanoneura TaxID=428564 RepID=A0A8D8LNU0_9HEMI